MSKLSLEIITAERVVYSEDVDILVAPGAEGELGILPQHAPLMTMLQSGEIRVIQGHEEYSIFVSGGFLEVLSDTVTVLADTAERAEEIDISRAEEARNRAQQRIETTSDHGDLARAQAAMLRSLMRLKVAEKTRKKRPPARQ